MPVSKKPRKKGTRCREMKACKKICRGTFKSKEDAKKTFEFVEDSHRKMRRKCEQISWMLSFVDKQSLLQAWIFIKKEEQLSFKLVRPPIGSKTGSTYRYLWPVIREGVAFAPAQRPPPLHFMAYRF